MGGMLWAAGLDSAALLREEIYQRATVDFPEAVLFKPVEPRSNQLSFALAPWILQEVKGPEVTGKSEDSFGAVNWSNGAVSVDVARPRVYVWTDSVEMNGKALARVAYLWCYADGAKKSEGQGVRLTLDSAGQPAVAEVLADGSGAELVFVSRRLEEAAFKEYGKPLAGRRFSVERSVDKTPSVVVARMYEDGPTAMGPMVYLSKASRSVSTLICRCMPAQAKQLRRTVNYELVEATPFPSDSVLARVRARMGGGMAFWPGETASDHRLERCLRLPKEF